MTDWSKVDWKDYPQYASSRFGKLAYASPVNSWPSIQELQKHSTEITPTRVDDGIYDITYNRTNRGIGTYLTVPSYGLDRINPYYADQVLNTAQELDRTDPNFYLYELRNKLQKLSPYPQITAVPERLKQYQPSIYPYQNGGSK